MDGIALPLTLTLIFVTINGFFVAAEFALVKARHTRIAALAAKGDRRAKSTVHILEHLDLYLSGCQLGITLASLVLGYLAEPAVARLIIMAVDALGLHVDHSVLHVIALVIALTVVTMLHMIFGEQAPKIWAIHTANKTSMAISLPLRIFVGGLRPLIWLINVMSNTVLRAIGIRSGAGEEVTHDIAEIRGIVARSAKDGYLTVRQGELAQNILSLAELEVRHIIVPRVDVTVIATDIAVAEVCTIIRKTGHSRLPLCEDGLDDVKGILHAKDLLCAMKEGTEPDLMGLVRPAKVVPESMSLSRFIRSSQSSRAGCAVVVDERGTAVGLAFLEDALEEIVGPLADEFDPADADSLDAEEGVIVMPGNTPLPEARELLDLDDLKGADTIAGLVVSTLDRMPKRGDTLTLGPYEVTVDGIFRHRVNRLRFELREEQTAEEKGKEEKPV